MLVRKVKKVKKAVGLVVIVPGKRRKLLLLVMDNLKVNAGLLQNVYGVDKVKKVDVILQIIYQELVKLICDC